MLRPLLIEDAQAVFNIIDSQRNYMREWLPFVDATLSIEDSRNAFKHLLSFPNDPLFAILYKENFVGLVGFKETNNDVRKTEIGYWLSQDYQKKGIVTQSVIKLLDYAFEEMNMNRVIIKAAVDNRKSRSIPERLGFVQEGIERDGDLLVGGVFTDIAVYSMLKQEYLEK